MATDVPSTDNHNLPKIPPLDDEYANEWGYIINEGEFSDGSDAGTDGLLEPTERRLILVDADSNKDNYIAYEDAIFYAKDSGTLYLGDGINWIETTLSEKLVEKVDESNVVTVVEQADEIKTEGSFEADELMLKAMSSGELTTESLGLIHLTDQGRIIYRTEK